MSGKPWMCSASVPQQSTTAITPSQSCNSWMIYGDRPCGCCPALLYFYSMCMLCTRLHYASHQSPTDLSPMSQLRINKPDLQTRFYFIGVYNHACAEHCRHKLSNLSFKVEEEQYDNDIGRPERVLRLKCFQLSR